MPETILHDYWRSSAAYRVRIGLNLLGLRYTSLSVDLMADEQRAPAYLARNPQGLVPSLEVDGQLLTQSLAILEYLNETRGAGWLPADPVARARVRALAHAVAIDTHPICNLRVASHAAALGGTTIEAWMQHFITAGLAGLEGMLAQEAPGRHCHGARVSLADICLVPQLYNARRWGVDMARFARIAEIGESLAALPAFAAAHPDRAHPDGAHPDGAHPDRRGPAA